MAAIASRRFADFAATRSSATITVNETLAQRCESAGDLPALTFDFGDHSTFR